MARVDADLVEAQRQLQFTAWRTDKAIRCTYSVCICYYTMYIIDIPTCICLYHTHMYHVAQRAEDSYRCSSIEAPGSICPVFMEKIVSRFEVALLRA